MRNAVIYFVEFVFGFFIFDILLQFNFVVAWIFLFIYIVYIRNQSGGYDKNNKGGK